MAIDNLKPSDHFHHEIAPRRNKRHPVESNEIINDLKITPEMFLQLCPALIVQIDGHDCIDDPEPDNPSTYTYMQGIAHFMFNV